MLTRKKKISTSKAKKIEVFYCFKLGKASYVTEYRMKRCLVCRWLQEWKPRHWVLIPTCAKTCLITSTPHLLRCHTLSLHLVCHQTVQ